MTIPVLEREEFFERHARELILQYDIRIARNTQYRDAQRVAYLFSQVIIKIYDARVGADAYIWLRDWSMKMKLRCDCIPEMELKAGKEIDCPFSTSVKRIYENLSFFKYSSILEELLLPSRKPLTKRSPVTRL